MTVKELIEALGSHDPEALVVLSKDSEGNAYHKLTPEGVSVGSVENPEEYYLEIGPFDEKEAEEGGWDPEDVYATKAVVLYP